MSECNRFTSCRRCGKMQGHYSDKDFYANLNKDCDVCIAEQVQSRREARAIFDRQLIEALTRSTELMRQIAFRDTCADDDTIKDCIEGNRRLLEQFSP